MRPGQNAGHNERVQIRAGSDNQAVARIFQAGFSLMPRIVPFSAVTETVPGSQCVWNNTFAASADILLSAERRALRPGRAKCSAI
jgi:hypothetical protein